MVSLSHITLTSSQRPAMDPSTRSGADQWMLAENQTTAVIRVGMVKVSLVRISVLALTLLSRELVFFAGF